jgi:hypothetical protein
MPETSSLATELVAFAPARAKVDGLFAGAFCCPGAEPASLDGRRLYIFDARALADTRGLSCFGRRSTVRVRQRALKKPCKWAFLLPVYPRDTETASRSRSRNVTSTETAALSM